MTTRKEYRSAFGEALSRQLESRHLTQRALATLAKATASYTSHVMAGRKPASPEFVERVAEGLKLPENDRAVLHRAAASDLGYKLDLTPPRSRAKTG